MIDWNKVNKLEEELSNKRVELIQAPTEEERAAKKAEVKYLEKQKEKIVGKKEFNRLKELKNSSSKEKAIAIYNEFKETEAKINPLNIATKRMVRKAMERDRRQKLENVEFTVVGNKKQEPQLVLVKSGQEAA